jgi:hypothetical protein
MGGGAEMDQLVLKRAGASRPSSEWSEDDYDVLCEGAVVGRVMKASAAPIGQPWLWTLAYGYHEGPHFAKSWRRNEKALQPISAPPGRRQGWMIPHDLKRA